jgi:hypothetical protein
MELPPSGEKPSFVYASVNFADAPARTMSAAAASGHSLHGRHDDGVHALQIADRAVQRLSEVVHELLAVLRRREARDVPADAEGLALAAQQDDPRVVAARLPHSGEELGSERRVERVAPVRPGEREAGGSTVEGVDEPHESSSGRRSQTCDMRCSSSVGRSACSHEVWTSSYSRRRPSAACVVVRLAG